MASLTIRENGITVEVEEARCLSGIAYIIKSVFDEYSFHPEPDSDSEDGPDGPAAHFQIPLNILLDCLNIFGTAGGTTTVTSQQPKQRRLRRHDDGSNDDEPTPEPNRIDRYLGANTKATGLRMSWLGDGHPLKLFIAEDINGPTTTCEIATDGWEQGLDLPYDDSQTILKVILKSSWLRDALSEFDPTYDKLTFICSENTGGRSKKSSTKPLLRLCATGSFGSTEMDYPDDREVLESFECVEDVQVSYRLSLISRTLRVLQASTKTSLRIDTDGLLSLQFISPPARRGTEADRSDGWIEFRCLPLEEDV